MALAASSTLGPSTRWSGPPTRAPTCPPIMASWVCSVLPCPALPYLALPCTASALHCHARSCPAADTTRLLQGHCYGNWRCGRHHQHGVPSICPHAAGRQADCGAGTRFAVRWLDRLPTPPTHTNPPTPSSHPRRPHAQTRAAPMRR